MIAHANYVRPTAEEQRRINAMLVLGCVACAFLGVPNLQFIECHHVVEGNRRLGHLYTIPLCSGHHRGIWSRAQFEWIPEEKRIALSSGRKAFLRIYPSERKLWETVQRKLELPLIWVPSKILPRQVTA